MKDMRPITWLKNPHSGENCLMENVKKVIPPGISRRTREVHRQILGYRMSPLKGLDNLSALLGLGGIWVKDESQRLNLNSFKILGGSFAIYSYLKNRLGYTDKDVSFSVFNSPEAQKKLSGLTFAAATDGNHGRGIAWAAGRIGCPAFIYVHKDTTRARIEAIESYGAKVVVVDGTYDEAVQKASADAKENGWQIIEDTSWEGYEEIPIWVMQGYTTMFAEVQEQLTAQGFIKPTHIFVQAGVGSLAGSIIGFYRGLFGSEAPISIVTEPARAACIYESARIGDGKPHSFGGDLDTIMAGLACGEPNPIAWNILRDCADYFITCPDYVAAKGMRVYGVPLDGDPFIVSGESGAVTLGALMFIMQSPGCRELKEVLNLGPQSQVLLINTEGNTDPSHFRQVVWEGSDPVPIEYRSI